MLLSGAYCVGVLINSSLCLIQNFSAAFRGRNEPDRLILVPNQKTFQSARAPPLREKAARRHGDPKQRSQSRRDNLHSFPSPKTSHVPIVHKIKMETDGKIFRIPFPSISLPFPEYIGVICKPIPQVHLFPRFLKSP